jgi:subtilisin family serine protease
MKLRLLGTVIVLLLLFSSSRAGSYGQRYIVTLKGGSIEAVNKAHGTQTIKKIPNTSTYLVKAADDDENGTILQDLRGDTAVESAEADAHVKLHSNQQASLSSTLADAMASLLDGHTLTTFFGTNVLQAYVNQPALTLTHVSDVRNISTGAGTRVAYIDTGVDPDHPALRPWLDPGVDLLNNSSASELDGLSDAMASLLDDAMASLLDKRFLFILDDAMASLLDGGDDGGIFPSALGHGTLVAGVIHVVAPNARIVPIKAFDIYGNTSMFRIIEGVYRARDLGVDVLNMSFSTPQYSVTLRKAIVDAAASGVAVVASAGNDGSYLASIYPASYTRVIGVGATDFSNHIASFSNYGGPISVMAPGAFVVSTVPGGRYAAAWGTSFSAPIVSGTLALMASSRGHGHSDTPLVINTADNIDSLNPGFGGNLGTGLINAQRALGGRN